MKEIFPYKLIRQSWHFQWFWMQFFLKINHILCHDPGNESVYFIFLCLAANGVESRPHPQAVVASILKGDEPAAVQRSMSMKATSQPLPRSPITSEGWLAWWAWHIPAVNKFNVHVYCICGWMCYMGMGGGGERVMGMEERMFQLHFCPL